MYNPYAISNYGYDPTSNNTAYRLNAVNQGEDNSLAQQTPANAQSRLIGKMVNPMPIQDNSSIIDVGQDSQNQAMKTMNTQGVGQTQLSHGLIGKSFDTAKTNVLDNATGGEYSKSKETYANVQNMMNGGFASSSGAIPALGNYTQGKIQDAFGIKPTTTKSPEATSNTQLSTPTSEHLGEHVGDGYYKLNNSYFQ